MKKLLDGDHPFFAPMWRRWATVLVPAVWAIVEFSMKSPSWGVLFAALSVWAFWELILKERSGPK